MQLACVVTTQEPSFALQQAPVGAGQAEQAVPTPRKLPPSVLQLDWEMTLQVPLAKQQAPVTGGQLAQAVLLPR